MRRESSWHLRTMNLILSLSKDEAAAPAAGNLGHVSPRQAIALRPIAGALIATTADLAEGVGAFRAKRPATFEDR